MYAPGQIVLGLTSCQPVKIGEEIWDGASYPSENTTNFIKVGRSGEVRYPFSEDEYCSYYDWGVAMPKSKELAEEALLKGIICVERPGTSQCQKCGGWEHKPNENCDTNTEDGDTVYTRVVAKYGTTAIHKEGE